MTTLTGTKQIERSVEIMAPQHVVWEVLSDSTLLPEWVPAVESVESCSEAEAEGAVRSCVANLAGRPGTMVERCVEYTPMRRIAYLIDDESFGMSRMFDDYGFALELEAGSDTTHVTLRTHYTPRNLLYRSMNAIVMRRRLGGVCQAIVDGLKSYCETRARQATS